MSGSKHASQQSTSTRKRKTHFLKKTKKKKATSSSFWKDVIEKKMDYFYTPYRKDFFKDAAKHMIFDPEKLEEKLDWSAISELILTSDAKPFHKTMQELNKIKSERLKNKLDEGKSTEFITTLLKIK